MSFRTPINPLRVSLMFAVLVSGLCLLLGSTTWADDESEAKAKQADESGSVEGAAGERLDVMETEKLQWIGAEKIQDPQNPLVLNKSINPGEVKVDVLEGADPAVKTQFDVALVSGDKEVVEDLQVWKDWEYKVAFTPVTNAEIKKFYEQLMEALRKEGYVFAKVTFPTRIWPTGIFLAKVDLGPLGDVTVSGNRFYSAKQIVRTLGSGQVDGRFNYNRFYQDLFDMNANPDLTVNTKLKPTVRDGRRVIDAELLVEDDFPVHGSVEFSNSGSGDSGDLRLRTTLQHNNLTKHGDGLTVEWLTDPEGTNVNAYSGSYYLPFSPNWSFNMFGGYSESDLDDVLPELNVRGEGWFLGAQFTRKLIEDEDKRVQLSLGWLFQEITQDNELSDFDLETQEVRVSMPMLTIGYASRRFDNWNGRNYFSNTILYSNNSHFGASASEDFLRGDGEFFIDRFQFARYQRLFAGEEHPGKWSLFIKVDGQLASDAVDSSMQKSVGGSTSVRGYEENEISGDDAVVASLELRTPLIQNFVPGLTKDEEYLSLNPNAWQKHRLQFLVFCDYGWVSIDDSEFEDSGDGRQKDENLLSVGAGFRLGLTKYSQMRLDWGFPLEETEEYREGGRGHFAVQLQF